WRLIFCRRWTRMDADGLEVRHPISWRNRMFLRERHFDRLRVANAVATSISDQPISNSPISNLQSLISNLQFSNLPHQRQRPLSRGSYMGAGIHESADAVCR